MGLDEYYYATLQDMVCPKCGHRGMDPDGDLDYVCPACGMTGSLEKDTEED